MAKEADKDQRIYDAVAKAFPNSHIDRITKAGERNEGLFIICETGQSLIQFMRRRLQAYLTDESRHSVMMGKLAAMEQQFKTTSRLGRMQLRAKIRAFQYFLTSTTDNGKGGGGAAAAGGGGSGHAAVAVAPNMMVGDEIDILIYNLKIFALEAAAAMAVTAGPAAAAQMASAMMPARLIKEFHQARCSHLLKVRENAKIVDMQRELANHIAANGAKVGPQLRQTQIIQIGEDHIGILMEYIDANNISSEEGSDNFAGFSMAAAVDLIRKIGMLHAAGIVHNDLHGENILYIRAEGQNQGGVKIIDFGEAKQLTSELQKEELGTILRLFGWDPANHAYLPTGLHYASQHSGRGHTSQTAIEAVIAKFRADLEAMEMGGGNRHKKRTRRRRKRRKRTRRKRYRTRRKRRKRRKRRSRRRR